MKTFEVTIMVTTARLETYVVAAHSKDDAVDEALDRAEKEYRDAVNLECWETEQVSDE